jgi:SAM-dependent methyltransferase
MAEQASGGVNYERTGTIYSRYRQPDPRIAARIHAAIGDARTVVNVGAGAGSYEPTDRHVIAIEPSRQLRSQRPTHLAPAVVACAEALPLDDLSVDASMATITVHHWKDRAKGLSELVRVTRGAIVVMAFDPERLHRLWINEYAPEYVAVERTRDVPIAELCAALEAGNRRIEVRPVPIPFDCTDGFVEAYYGRPERFLDEDATRAQSGWTFVAPEALSRFRATLAADLASGAWDARHGHWRQLPQYEGSLRLIVSTPA